MSTKKECPKGQKSDLSRKSSDSKDSQEKAKPFLLKETHASRVVKELHAQMRALKSYSAASAAAPTKAGWFSASSPSDSKDPVQPDLTVGAMKAAVATAKASLASVYGKKPVPFIIPLSVAFQCSVSTGVANTVLPVTVTDAVEWASLAALFDEYRVAGGRLDYFIPTPTSTVVLGTSTLNNNANAAVGYDPVTPTSAASAREVTELGQHQQLFPRMIATPTVGTYVGVYGRDDNKPYQFKFSVADVSAVLNGANGASSPGMWKSTAVSTGTLNDGYIRPYYASGETTVKEVILGTLYLHVMLKSRS